MNRSLGKAVAALVLLGASFAVAQDAKVLPGTICQPRGGSVNYLSGSISNTSTTSSLAALCPLVRDNNTALNPAVSSASVWVVNRGPANGSVACVLSAYIPNALGSVIVTKASTSISATPQQLVFPTLTLFSGSGHALEVECTLPAKQAAGESMVRNLAWADP